MYKSLRLKQALESKIGRTIEKEMGLKQMERDSINLVDQGRRRMKDHIEEFALALTRSLLLPEVDDGEEKQFVEAKIKEFVSDLSGLRMEKEDQGEEEEEEEQEEMMCVGEEQVAAAAAKAEESEEFLERRREVGVEVQTADEFLERSRKAEMKTGEEELPGAEDCLERSRKVKLQAAEKEFLERHRDCKAEVEGAVVLEEDGAIDKSVTEKEEIWFAGYRSGWERTWGNGHSFENLTLLSSMLFTHCTPGCLPMDAVVGKTFQVYSVRVTETKGLKWPLKVYGVVAARDEVDKHRNPLFLRSRENCQILYKEVFMYLGLVFVMSEGTY